jgi:hypothetical protein
MEDDCDVCCGTGAYPVINTKGATLYNITCPECYGSGQSPEPDPEPDDLPPASTAAKIKTMDDLFAWMRRENPHRNPV